MMITLRPYQNDAVAAALASLMQGVENPVVVLPTGGGKTPVLAAICQHFARRGGKVIILSHVKELLEQSKNTLQKIAPELPVGVYSAGLGQKENRCPITVAGIQSVYQKAEEFEPFDLIIVDECHLIPPSGEGMYQTFLRACKTQNPFVKLLGLTATPFRTGQGMICTKDGLLNHICYEIKVGDLIQQGFLSPLISKNGSHKADFRQLHIQGGEFVSAEVESLVNTEVEIYSAVAEIVRRTQDRKFVLIFAASVEHAKNIQRVLQRQSGQEVGLVTGQTESSERAEIIQRFRGESIPGNLFGDTLSPLKYVVNVNVLTTGFDAPNIDCIALMRPTMSPGLYVQMVGRGLRKCEGKENCLVLDYGENILRHGCIDDIFIRQPGQKGNAPTKECPKCHEVLPLSTRKCPQCGHIFEMEKKTQITENAADAAILSKDTKPETWSVQWVDYIYWDKNAEKTPTVRVIYHTLFKDYSEWICPSHFGIARRKFEFWWRARQKERKPLPQNSLEAVNRANKELKIPDKIVVKKELGKRWEKVVDYVFSEKG